MQAHEPWMYLKSDQKSRYYEKAECTLPGTKLQREEDNVETCADGRPEPENTTEVYHHELVITSQPDHHKEKRLVFLVRANGQHDCAN